MVARELIIFWTIGRDSLAAATIYRLEKGSGPVMGYVSTVTRIQTALENAGIHFLDKDTEGGIGVRLAR
jgi:hypothetical protein